jgi:NADH-quinone oxidoreductase subunit A
MLESYIPILGTIIVGALFGIAMMKLHEVVGPRRLNKEKLSTYESGMEPVTSVKERHTVKFYLVAMLFILFDIEIVFMYPWAVQFKQLGAQALVAMVLFMVLLFVGFIYVVKKGALEWD